MTVCAYPLHDRDILVTACGRICLYVGFGVTKFSELVDKGIMPSPIDVDGTNRWDRLQLDAAVENLKESVRLARALQNLRLPRLRSQSHLFIGGSGAAAYCLRRYGDYLCRRITPRGLDGNDWFVRAAVESGSARDANREFLSELRRVERKTRLRAEWAAGGSVERFFDYVSKGTQPAGR